MSFGDYRSLSKRGHNISPRRCVVVGRGESGGSAALLFEQGPSSQEPVFANQSRGDNPTFAANARDNAEGFA